MPIYIDDREGSKSLANLRPLNNVSKPYHAELYNFEDDRIPGDAWFFGNGPSGTVQIGVEVKVLASDFVASVDSGRLTGEQSQIPRMLEWFDYSYLVIYGPFRAAKTTEANFPVAMYQILKGKRSGQWSRLKLGNRLCPFGWVNSVNLELQLHGVKVLTVASQQEVAYALVTIYNWWQKRWDKHKLFDKFNTAQEAFAGRIHATLSDNTLKLSRVVNQLLKDSKGGASIGYRRALTIAEEFTTPLEMFQALASEPDRIAELYTGKVRIGKVLAKALQAAVGGPIDQTVDQRMMALERKIKKSSKELAAVKGMKGKQT